MYWIPNKMLFIWSGEELDNWHLYGAGSDLCNEILMNRSGPAGRSEPSEACMIKQDSQLSAAELLQFCKNKWQVIVSVSKQRIFLKTFALFDVRILNWWKSSCGECKNKKNNFSINSCQNCYQLKTKFDYVIISGFSWMPQSSKRHVSHMSSPPSLNFVLCHHVAMIEWRNISPISAFLPSIL